MYANRRFRDCFDSSPKYLLALQEEQVEAMISVPGSVAGLLAVLTPCHVRLSMYVLDNCVVIKSIADID